MYENQTFRSDVSFCRVEFELDKKKNMFGCLPTRISVNLLVSNGVSL